MTRRLSHRDSRPERAHGPLLRRIRTWVARTAIAALPFSSDHVLAGDTVPVPRFIVGVAEKARSKVICSGVLIRGGRALTARHCLAASVSYIHVEGSPSVAARTAWIGTTVDVAALYVGASSGGVSVSAARTDGELAALELWVATRKRGLVRAYVHAGQVDSTHVRVVSPEAKLCYGDSGSPLLSRREGKLEIVGILDVGDAECKIDGVNRFARVDGNAELRRR